METTYASAIQEIVQSVYSTMLNIDLIPSEGPIAAERDWLLSSVQITGQWMGSVVLAFSPQMAADSAVAMLQTPADSLTDADRNDVAAELANMVGGNLKSILPSPSMLSLPTVVAGREPGLHVYNAAMIDDVLFGSGSGSLRVCLHAKI
jgi:chemotaxis protein CheX